MNRKKEVVMPRPGYSDVDDDDNKGRPCHPFVLNPPSKLSDVTFHSSRAVNRIIGSLWPMILAVDTKQYKKVGFLQGKYNMLEPRSARLDKNTRATGGGR
jgi:hypothetical protein